MSQIILACDYNGNFLEYIPKEIGHTGEGKRHLAVTVLIYNSKGEILLQRRKHNIFDNLWDFTASTHPLHTEIGDETSEEASERALKEEFSIEDIKLKKVGEFNYYAQIGDYCENEHDYLLIGEYNGEVKLNPEVGYEYKWMDKKEFIKDFASNPEKYTEWTQQAVKLLKENGQFFQHLNGQ